MKLVHTDAGESEYTYWSHSLADFPIEQLRQGVKKAEDWPGFLTLGDFRKLCQKEVGQASHQPFTPLPHPSTWGNGRFRELQKVTQAMSAEVGVGPITQATRAGKLDKYFIKGKSADEIIAACQRLYG